MPQLRSALECQWMGCGWAAGHHFFFVHSWRSPRRGSSPTGRWAPHDASQQRKQKKKYPKSQISHLVHPLNSFRFASNFHILLGRAVEVKSFIARVSTAADVWHSIKYANVRMIGGELDYSLTISRGKIERISFKLGSRACEERISDSFTTASRSGDQDEVICPGERELRLFRQWRGPPWLPGQSSGNKNWLRIQMSGRVNRDDNAPSSSSEMGAKIIQFKGEMSATFLATHCPA